MTVVVMILADTSVDVTSIDFSPFTEPVFLVRGFFNVVLLSAVCLSVFAHYQIYFCSTNFIISAKEKQVTEYKQLVVCNIICALLVALHHKKSNCL